MPGVPSGRGCGACRKQKKKCDQSQPSCSRCTRLQIACVGCGQRRYKFQEQTIVKSAQTRKARVVISPLSLSRTPSNETTVTIGALVAALELKDPRYDLSCYGGFLKEIPKRLGTNSALDASVTALTTAFSSLLTRQHIQSIDATAKYGQALKRLRIGLQNPSNVSTVDTLCAIYLVMVCQGWIGKRDDEFVAHGEIMAHLLNTTTPSHWQGQLEAELLITLCIPILFESMINPNIQLDPWLWKQPEAFGPKAPAGKENLRGIQSLSLPKLAKIPHFIRESESHHPEIQTSYQRMLVECNHMKKLLATFPGPVSLSLSHVVSLQLPIQQLLARYQVVYGMLLTLAMILNTILRAFEPHDVILVQESVTLPCDIMTLAKQASPFRPLAAGYIPLCLTATWAATDNPHERLEAELLLEEYQTDFASANWLQIAIWLHGKYEALRFRLATAALLEESSAIYFNVSNSAADTPEAMIGGGGSCCIM